MLSLALAALLLPSPVAAPTPPPGLDGGVVLSLNNDVDDNAIVVGLRLFGFWFELGQVSTGGRGTGSGLGSQGALVQSDNGRRLLAVNAGSDEITLLARFGPFVLPLDRASTGGTRPTSVDVHHDLVYVLNAGSDEVAGFRMHRGQLEPIGRASLSGTGVAAAQVGFDPSGRHLVVSERATNRLVVFPVLRDGSLGAPTVNDSEGMTPFGFAFRKDGTLVVSEAAGGAPGASTVSSYAIRRDGSLEVLSSAVPTHQSAACWIAIPNDGRFAYTTNTASSNLSGFALGRPGRLSLLDPSGVSGSLDAGATPIDFDFGRNGKLLFVLDSTNDEITAFRRLRDGSLEQVPGSLSLPDGAAGVLAD